MCIWHRVGLQGIPGLCLSLCLEESITRLQLAATTNADDDNQAVTSEIRLAGWFFSFKWHRLKAKDASNIYFNGFSGVRLAYISLQAAAASLRQHETGYPIMGEVRAMDPWQRKSRFVVPGSQGQWCN